MTADIESTRRVLVPVRWPEGRVGRGHLLPDLRSWGRRDFVRVPGGRPATHGMVAYVGRPVTALDMLRRWESRVGPLVDEASSLEVLEAYVSWLVRQPLGAVFAAAHDEAGQLVPVRVADRLPVERIPIPE